MSPTDGGTLTCAMCRKSQNEVRKLIAGTKFNICNECVALGFSILATDQEWLDAALRQAHVVKAQFDKAGETETRPEQ